MNLAYRDVRHNLFRFVLTCFGLSLLMAVVLSMVGIYNGLVVDALTIARASSVDLWVVEAETRGPFAEASRIPGSTREAIARLHGVDDRGMHACLGARPVSLPLECHALGVGHDRVLRLGRVLGDATRTDQQVPWLLLSHHRHISRRAPHPPQVVQLPRRRRQSDRAAVLETHDGDPSLQPPASSLPPPRIHRSPRSCD